jgi:hypothetical protein
MDTGDDGRRGAPSTDTELKLDAPVLRTLPEMDTGDDGRKGAPSTDTELKLDASVIPLLSSTDTGDDGRREAPFTDTEHKLNASVIPLLSSTDTELKLDAPVLWSPSTIGWTSYTSDGSEDVFSSRWEDASGIIGNVRIRNIAFKR